MRLAAALLALSAIASTSFAQDAWIADQEVNLTLRTGAGSQYRIIGSLTTGDAATILERAEGWTKIRTAEGKEGWVAAGFLQQTPPARVELASLERDAQELRRQLADLSKQVADLGGANDALASRDEQQRAEIERLARENHGLRAGARWPEWITGAGIVLVGMGLGAVLGRSASRRRQPRVRL
ncbi:MAG TPA: TIGR04211 family SH3 domain-containing protein [Myxococcota bacterium]|nr:TIGR04211 family SH3 domain-containing protein [Myxococcota bacterium]